MGGTEARAGMSVRPPGDQGIVGRTPEYLSQDAPSGERRIWLGLRP
jgi:hypothetical protein